MDNQRDQVVDRILAIERHVYHFVRRGGFPSWAQLDLTMPQLKVLVFASMFNPVRASQVARTLKMTPSTATGVVDRLVSQGLIGRLEDPADRRIVLLQATPRGKEAVDHLFQAGRECLKEMLDRLSLEELQVVARALDLLHEATVAIGADPPQECCVEPETTSQPSTNTEVPARS